MSDHPVKPETKSFIREVREWSTLFISFLTLIAIPVGVLILNNQRLAIEANISEHYISKVTYSQDQDRERSDRLENAKQLGELRGKVDSVLLEQVHINDTMLGIRERLNINNNTK